MRRAHAILAALAIVVSARGQNVTNGNFRAERNAPKQESTRPAKPEAAKPKTYPFHGELESADSAGQWIRLRGKTKPREILVSKETRISNGVGEKALAGARPGQRVTGSVFRNGAGREEARTIKIGPLAEKKLKP